MRVKISKVSEKDKLFHSRQGDKCNVSCYHCGLGSHIAKYCQDKDKGNKCYFCSGWGYHSFESPKKNIKPEVSVIDFNTNANLKVVTKFNDLKVNTLIEKL